ncbi:MAG: response regulator [Actinobacteria bacterium QS_8_72_14]|jgi:CheY-like chemotaxis protein|nr:MAG: response regulator [Actinobacteria bacterium QS_8_72_14]
MFGGAVSRVLVVDDDAVIRNLLEVNLQLEGYEVSLAIDGGDALTQVAAAPPDLILLDVMMPGMDGWDVAKRLKDDEIAAAIPVVLLTARAMRADVQRGTDLGVEGYVTKPFDPDELLAVIDRLLGAGAGERR